MSIEAVLVMLLYLCLWVLVLVLAYYIITWAATALKAPEPALQIIRIIFLCLGLIVLIYFVASVVPPLPVRR